MENWLFKDDSYPNQLNYYWVKQNKHHPKVEIPHFTI